MAQMPNIKIDIKSPDQPSAYTGGDGSQDTTPRTPARAPMLERDQREIPAPPSMDEFRQQMSAFDPSGFLEKVFGRGAASVAEDRIKWQKGVTKWMSDNPGEPMPREFEELKKDLWPEDKATPTTGIRG